MPHLTSVGLDESEARAIAEQGLALIDEAFSPIAMDKGAVSILGAMTSSGRGGGADSRSQRIPPTVMEQIALATRKATASKAVDFVVGSHCYRAEACLMYPGHSGTTRPWIIVRFKRAGKTPADTEALAELAMTCGLTEREKEVLSAIAIGLTSKEVAHRMNISASTVKSFLRLIKLKTGGRNRADIVARMLEPH